MDDEALNLAFPKYVCRRSFFLAPRASLPRPRSRALSSLARPPMFLKRTKRKVKQRLFLLVAV